MLEEEWKVNWYLNIQVVAAGPTEVRLTLLLLKYSQTVWEESESSCNKACFWHKVIQGSEN